MIGPREGARPPDWTSVPLESLLKSSADLTYGIVQPGPDTAGGIPIVRVKDIRNGRVAVAEPIRVAPEVERSYERSRLEGGELLVTLVGTVGECAVAPPSLRGWNTARAVAVARIRQEIGAPWIALCMSLRESRDRIAARVNTTVQTTLNLRDLRQMPVLLPPDEERWGIAATLGALDDKIESNERAISLTEHLADAVFARSADGMHALAEIGTLTMGSSPPGESYNQAGIGLPFYQGVRDFGRRSPTRRVWTSAPVRRAEDGDSLISVRAPVGRLNRATETCCIGRGLAALSSPWPSCALCALRAADELWLPYQGEGTVFGAINRADLAGCGLQWPSDTQRRDDLEANLAPLDAKIASLVRESGRLELLRDALLPELLAGRLRVPEAREAFADAVDAIN